MHSSPGAASLPSAECHGSESFDYAALIFRWVRRVCSGRHALAAYVRSALSQPAASPAPPRSLYPMPPPYAWSHGPSPRDAPARRAWLLQRAAELLVNLMVLSLSHLHLRGARRCPGWARQGVPLSPEQRSVAAFLRARADEYLSPLAPPSDREFRSALLMSDIASAGILPIGSVFSPRDGAGPLRLDPARSVFAKTNADFEPTEHLGTFAAACYIDPDLLSRARLPGGVPPESLVASGPQRGIQCDILGYLQQWDHHHRLLLEPPWTTSRTQQGTLFPVPKTADTDRIVFNRIPRNRHEMHLPGYARFTVGGHDLIELVMQPGDALRIFAEDLADCFPSFRASRARGVSNALAWTAPVAAFHGTRAYRDLERNCLRRSIPMPSRVRPCYLGLPMGDLNAADFAAEAHTRVIRKAGSYPPERAVTNGAPMPRARAVEALVIDDHVAVSLDRPGENCHAKILEESFDRAAAAYEKVGLKASAGKARRGDRQGVVLGAEFVADSTFLGAERARRRRLAEASVLAASSGQSTRHLLRRLLGAWTHALLFRRVLMCIFSSIYKFVGEPSDQDHIVVKLPHAVCRELLLAAVLCPLMVTNMAAGFVDQLVCSDASPFGEGAAASRLSADVVAELWRHRERRGGYTRVLTHWAAQLRLAGLKEEAVEQQTADTEGFEDDHFGSSPCPERVLIECYDNVEICCGSRSPLIEAMRSCDLRTGPRIDLAYHPFWDITRARVFEWLFFLAERGRVAHWHSGVPCTDFSIARHPTVRTHQYPWGFEPKEPARAVANFMLSIVGVIILILARVGYGSLAHEHPASAHSWAIPFWGWFQRQPRAEIGRFCACRFGAPYRKDTRLARFRAEFLRPLDQMCICVGPHRMQLAGSETKRAAEYLPDFCRQYADALAEDLRSRPGEPGSTEVEALRDGTPPRFEKLWVNDLLRELPWRATSSRMVGGDAHINVREIRAAIRHGMQHVGGARSVRLLELLDSRVSIGALAKGRSASTLLNDELRAAMPETVSRDLYFGYLFAPSRLNPGDAPSRLMPLPRIVGGGVPAWAQKISESDFTDFEKLLRLPCQSKSTAGWALLTWRLAKVSGVPLSPKELPFDSTLGFPGEGPRNTGAPASLRAAIDIRSHRVLTAEVAQRRSVRLEEFLQWCWFSFGLGRAEVLALPVDNLDRFLTEFGQWLWRRSRSLLDFSETINSLVDLDRARRGHLPRAWEAAWVWRSLTPSSNRVPMPEKVLLAMVTVALSWGFPHVALLLLSGFTGLLRVHELRWLRLGSFMTPRRLMHDDQAMFVVIEKPKMRRLAARRSYVRIDDAGIIEFADAVVAGRPEEAFLFDGSYAQLRGVFCALCAEVGVPHGAPRGLTLGSLRPGGATWLYRLTDNSEAVRFRGRWASSRMLEIYIQEVGASSVLPLLSETARHRISTLALLAPSLMSSFVHNV